MGGRWGVSEAYEEFRGERTVQFEDIFARVRVLDGKEVSMEIGSSAPRWDVHADMVLKGVDDERIIEWLYGQFDQVLAELRRQLRRGMFSGEVGHGED